MKTPDLGDTVYILAKRSDGGCVSVPAEHSKASTFPVEKCVVAQVNICGIPGCYGLKWADNGQPVGLPFYLQSFVSEDGTAEY